MTIDAFETPPAGVSLTVNRPPEQGKSFWLVVQAKYSKTDVEYYAQREVSAKTGEKQRITLNFNDLSFTRTAQIFELTETQAEPLRAQLEQPVDTRPSLDGWPCDDCAASDDVQVTPLKVKNGTAPSLVDS